MRTPDQPFGCEQTVARLEASIDGELTSAEQARVDAHLAECDACSDELLHAAAVRRSLRELPILHCPPKVVAAAEREHRNELRSTWFDMPRWAAASLAVAASLALIAMLPDEQPDEATAEAQRTEQALVQLQATLQTQATSVGRKTFERSVVKPTRTVVAAVTESPLGRWSAKAASLLGSPDPTASDAT